MDTDENAIEDTSVEEVGEVRIEGAEENNEGQRETIESNRAVVAINEDELKRNKGKQGNKAVILSTYDDEESVRKDREDSEDPDESTADVLIFADTLSKKNRNAQRERVKQNGNGLEKLLN